MSLNQTQGISLLLAAILLWNPFNWGWCFGAALAIIVVNAIIELAE
jgi:hypothetical protein